MSVTDSGHRTLRKAPALAAGIAYLSGLVQGFAFGFPANSILFVTGDTASCRALASLHMCSCSRPSWWIKGVKVHQ